jgi:hypothetical protein
MTSAQREKQQLEASSLNAREYKCPDCGAPTHFMGIDFKAPKKSDEKAWSTVEAAILCGKIYYRDSE